MTDVRLNSLKNRLYITLGDWNQADMRAYVRNIESACNALVSGFTCLIVLQKNGMVRQKDQDLLFSTTDLISAYGAEKIAYVRKANGNAQMSRISPFNFQTFTPVEHVLSIQEAEEFLDAKSRKSDSSGGYSPGRMGEIPSQEISSAKMRVSIYGQNSKSPQ